MSSPENPRRWLVTGAGGMLGHDVVAGLRETGAAAVGLTRDSLDVADETACRTAVDGNDVVVNCAAWTDVDAAENHEAQAFAVNATGAANLARASSAVGARLIQISTDYVFDGSASAPYAETAPLRPGSAYGRTKAAGEWAARAEHDDVLVVRTGWLYGAHGRSFPRTIAAALGTREHLDVVADQVGQPTWTHDVAAVILALVNQGAPPGIYHATSSGRTSWYGFAREVAQRVGADPARIRETTSSALAKPAPRPAFSVLGHQALVETGVPPIGDWRDRFAVAAPTVLKGVR